MVPDHENLLMETYKLARENNRMLHAMRRNAFLGGLLKFIIYAALIVVPFWFYLQYLQPVLGSAMKTMNQAQSTGVQLGSGFNDMLTKLKSIPGIGNFGE